MKEEYTFSPPRRQGLVFQAAAILILVAVGVWGLWQASRARAGAVFLLYLAPGTVAVALAPALFYRAMALQRAAYALGRDGILLRWGLRSEDIPMDVVRWVGMAEAFPQALPRPWLVWPGSVLGVRTLPDGRPLEYLAARASRLVLISTTEGAFAISPEKPEEFLSAFRHVTEFGSLASIPPRSVYPNLLAARIWADRYARLMLMASLALGLGLLIWVSLAIPAHPRVALSLSSTEEPVPGVRLLLLPVLNALFLVINLLLGFFFYRHKETQPLSYLMWGAGVLTSLLFLGGVFFILNAS